MSIFKTSDKVLATYCFLSAKSLRFNESRLTTVAPHAVQSLHETYRFAKLKSWAATTDTCTFKVSKDEGKHKLQKEVVVYSTEMVSTRV